MKLSILILLLCSLTATVRAQHYTQTVKGKITDADSRITLPGATVVVAGTDPMIGAVSDMDGNFKLEKVPVGRQDIIVSFVGYEEVIINDVVVSTGREVMLEVKMKESVTSLSEVTVTASLDKSEAINQMATVSSTQLTVEETSRIAAGINDPGRTAQSFAGVAAADDENNELVIRGNSPRSMLWRMEGVEIPNPNHFTNGEGGSGGGVSALSTQVLDNSDFFTGAFPAEYGNALSGVFDLNLRKGNAEKREYALQLGVMGAQAALEGPFKKGSEASYLLNYRYSTLKLLGKAGIDISGGDIVPEWQDLSFKVYAPTKKLGRFSIWGLGGISDAGSTAVQDTALWEYRGDAYEDTENHTLGVVGVTNHYLFSNNKTYLRTVLSMSYTNDKVVEDSLDYNFNKSIVEESNFSYNTLIISSYLNHKFDAKNILRYGIIYQNKGFNSRMESLNYDTRQMETLVDAEGRTNMAETYLQWQHRVNNDLEINSGAHVTYLSLNNDYAIEPRLGARWRISPKSTLNFGAGLHSRVEAISLYMAEQELPDGSIIQPNKELKLTKAAHVVFGYNWNFAPDFRLKSEVYYQHLYNVPVKPGDTTNTFSALNFSSGYTNENLVNEGSGRNYGIELTLEKFFSRGWYGLATTSLFQSKYTMPDGIERNTVYNSNYIVNVVGGKEFKVGKSKQNVIGANFRTILRGGYRTVPVDLEASHAMNKEVRNYDQAFETRVPDYFRTDIGVSFRKNNPNWSWILSLDIQNVTNRLNIWDEYYSYERESMEYVYMNGLIPVLNYRVEF
jgi:hypothetical protein